ncbi:hypothetical protein V8F06_009660 [Rhypophila decipiens]
MLIFITSFLVLASGLPMDVFQHVDIRSLNKPALTLSLENNAIGANGTSQGWTSSPNNRGTLDIIWSCALTVFLCGWSTICVNIPPLGTGRLQNLWRKILVFLEALAGPEFIVHTALGQYVSAHLSVKEFADVGLSGWTTRHGFFADMGGFVLDPPDFVPFPLTVSQLHYLVVNGYVDYDEVLLTNLEIEDKNKFDTLTRIITMVQLSWFVVNLVARVALNMAITTLELSTAAFIFCTLFTYFCWRHKPQDVSCPIVIKPKIPLADILVRAGPVAARPYSYTPLDFARRRPHIFELIWRYCFNIPNSLRVHFHPTERPITKIWDDQFLDLPPWANVLLALAQFGFAGIHFAAWNFYFPTHDERFLWHLSSIYIPCSMVCTWIVLHWAFEIWPRISDQLENPNTATKSSVFHAHIYSRWNSSKPYHLLRRISQRLCNNSPNRDPDETVPLLTVVVLVPLGVLYLFARFYVILEDFYNLRDLPASAYNSVDWGTIIPHF